MTFQDKYSAHWKMVRARQKIFIHCYNIIPSNVLKSPILEIGCGEGVRQVACRHKEFFLNSDYIGIDLLRAIKPELRIIRKNILDFCTTKRFKTILLIGSLEHIALDKWPFVIAKLKKMCDKDGNIIIYIPFKESINYYMINKGDHLVYGITPEFMQFFFPEASIKIIYDQMIKRFDESYIWGIGRWIKRVLTFNKMALRIIPRRRGLLVIWNKVDF